MSRPDVLFPLFADLTTLDGVGPKVAKLFERMEIGRPADLILTLPTGGIDRRLRGSVREVRPGEVATVEVVVGMHQPGGGRTRPYRVFVRDALTEFQLVFFHPHPDWLKRTLPSGQRRIVSGKLEIFDGIAQMAHPDHILRPEEAEALPAYGPVYPLTQGLNLKTMVKAAASAVSLAPDLPEWIEPSLKRRHGWPDWRPALAAAHTPAGPADLSPAAKARERLAYDELLSHQLTLAIARSRMKRGRGLATRGDGRLQAKVLAALPYAPTGAQTRAIARVSWWERSSS